MYAPHELQILATSNPRCMVRLHCATCSLTGTIFILMYKSRQRELASHWKTACCREISRWSRVHLDMLGLPIPSYGTKKYSLSKSTVHVPSRWHGPQYSILGRLIPGQYLRHCKTTGVLVLFPLCIRRAVSTSRCPPSFSCSLCCYRKLIQTLTPTDGMPISGASSACLETPP